MKRLVVRPDARDEMDHALSLSSQATEFRQAIADALALLASGVVVAARVRRTLCRRFILTTYPYSLVYEESDDVIEIVVFAHSSRRPGYWKDRLS